MNTPQRSLFDTAPDPWELDAAEQRLIAEVVFAEPPYGPYSYLVPDALAGDLQAGQRVYVPLGNQRERKPGYCIKVEARAVGQRRLRPITGLLDEAPLLSNSMLRLTEWMADYYLCPWGQVLQGVIPSGVRGQAGTREMTFLSILPQVAELVKKVVAGQSAAIKPTSRVKLSPELVISGTQFTLLSLLQASPRPLTPPELAEAAKCSLATVSGLRKKRLVEISVRRIQQVEVSETATPREDHLQLQDDQRAALETILLPLRARQHATILIHGVTGSGKTEVYIRAIDEVIHFGRQAIVLVPEISLTPQTRERFRSRFENVAVLHSHLSDAERHWHWQRISRGEIQVVVGARSAVFAPTPHLGLIILDEEHDSSFKQGEAPRYHAREVALQRAKGEGVPLVLGSATPALESWQRALTDEFRLVEMLRRVSDRPLPSVDTIDLRTEGKGSLSRGAISRPLERAMKGAIAEDGQVILLLNRRGYSTHIQCPSCGQVVNCPHCDVALTHHREEEKVRCHYCDYIANPPLACPNCRFDGMRYGGMGTERLEAELKAKFPGVPLLRMDSDTMQKPGSHEIALDQFRSGAAKILLGTQMIAKGLDFPNVTLVGVVNADAALHFSDFRAAERTFQLVTQVAGRTGRGDKGGRVLVQTYSPEHGAIQAAIRHDYRMFAFFELPTRKEFHYPPYAALIRMIIRGEVESAVQQFAEATVERLRVGMESIPGEHRLLGPTPCSFAKLRGKFRYHLLATATDGATLRNVFREVLPQLPTSGDVQWVVDVDPVDLL